ncbi:MAG: histidine--tRNA ligase [Candidatus Levybacteria bacterium]|nr:histidine--tRNA ligase [Candidatus Levybacteria bacterium]
MVNVQTLKGFRDFLPTSSLKRQFVLDTLRKVFISYGFEPLETPALEYEEILTGKYGAEGDKLMYKFTDNGGRKVALKYDQTVPLARVVAQYQNALPLPFKRYQMQNVYRAENTQKGRYREFLQVDIDIVGVYSPLSDAEVIAVLAKSLEKLGFKNFKVLVNDRKVFENLSDRGITDKDIPVVVRTIDKLKKIGKEKVIEELVDNGVDNQKALALIEALESQKPTPKIQEILSALSKMGIDEKLVEFLPTLARGLDYYTGVIFEVEIDGYDVGSIAGGGRYDNLIGIFKGSDVPAVGFAFGFDRLMEAMETLDLFPKDLNSKNILIAFSTSDLEEKALEAANQLRTKGLNTQIFLEDATLEKQLKYADKKQIPFVLIVNEDDFILKNMQSGEQKSVTLGSLPDEL